ncbi:MAG: NrdH-redoxin [Rhodospirillaceae bacterium]|uniref:Glutaredoxin domain-containing protein n=1 Tax=Candidatus Moanibacter tarae TaxID=2200854 RepID=A0A2Z4AHG9_9BACT|nr:MAG: hypothetical protein DF168_00878 [Candidatus Moanabacter tarae]MBH66941.1 NrdH-redoxin [Rhodospirillaceae bacterium]|tara:strand:+ start:9934 stop:10224 length:291 start_codon:yes stop_codon:yes gene_type:complete
MNESKPKLYVKQGCPWCSQAIRFLQDKAIDVDLRDVNKSSTDFQRLIEISGQTLTPTLEFEEFMVVDFSVPEFIRAINERPDVKRKLGIGPNFDQT